MRFINEAENEIFSATDKRVGKIPVVKSILKNGDNHSEELAIISDNLKDSEIVYLVTEKAKK